MVKDNEYIVQKNGTVRIPSYLMRKYKIEIGDSVFVTEYGAIPNNFFTKDDNTAIIYIFKRKT